MYFFVSATGLSNSSHFTKFMTLCAPELLPVPASVTADYFGWSGGFVHLAA